jgi:hypothetical protein
MMTTCPSLFIATILSITMAVTCQRPVYDDEAENTPAEFTPVKFIALSLLFGTLYYFFIQRKHMAK